MSVVESHTVIALHRYFISHVGVLPEWCAGMGQTSTSNVTRHYQGATLWDEGKKKWVRLLINELVKYQPISQRGAGYKDSTPKWIGNRPPKYRKCKHVPLSLAPQNREINSTIQARSSINKSKWRVQPIGSKIHVTKINHCQWKWVPDSDHLKKEHVKNMKYMKMEYSYNLYNSKDHQNYLQGSSPPGI